MDKLDKPRLYVDFNEMLEPGLYLLSKTDTRLDSDGNTIALTNGMNISIYSDDLNDRGERDYLIAEAVVERNTTSLGWGTNVKWCCRVDRDGIKHESDLRGSSKE